MPTDIKAPEGPPTGVLSDAESHIDEVTELHREKTAKHRLKQNLRTYGKRLVVPAPIPGD